LDKASILIRYEQFDAISTGELNKVERTKKIRMEEIEYRRTLYIIKINWYCQVGA